MYTDIELQDMKRRNAFYNTRAVAKFLLAAGIPKTHKAMMALTSLENPEARAVQVPDDCLTKVIFELHPQQVNIRDKINGNIIASIAR
jgi:hypothetical protein